MTGDGDTVRANPFRGFTQQLGRIFGKGGNVDTPNLINDIVGMSSGVLGNPENTHHSSHDISGHQNPTHHSEEQHDAHGAHGAHADYHFSPYFERAVELINAAAGMLVIASVLLAGLNLILVAFNANFDTKFRIINPLHHGQSKTETATISRIRLMLGEHTALALGVLVAADVLDTVLKPAHAYQLADVVKMGAVMAVRTTLAYFLSKEIKELEEGEEHMHHQASGGSHSAPPHTLASSSHSERARSHSHHSEKPYEHIDAYVLEGHEFDLEDFNRSHSNRGSRSQSTDFDHQARHGHGSHSDKSDRRTVTPPLSHAQHSSKSMSSIGAPNGRMSSKGLLRSSSADANSTYDVLYRTSGGSSERGREERFSVPSTASNNGARNIVLPQGYKRSGSWPLIAGQSGGEGGVIREVERENGREVGQHGGVEGEGEGEDEDEGECGSVSMSRDDDVSPTSTCVTDSDRNSERNCNSNKIEGDEEEEGEGDMEVENENENTSRSSVATKTNENENSVKQLLNPKGSKKNSTKQKRKSQKKQNF